MQKENSLFCLVLGLVPNKSLNRIFASYDLCNLLGYGTNRACWECISLNSPFDEFVKSVIDWKYRPQNPHLAQKILLFECTIFSQFLCFLK